MITIRTNTTFTAYTKSTVIKPRHPLWKLKNVSIQPAVINDILTLNGGGNEFGVDVTPLLLPLIEHLLDKNPKEKIEIVNDTQFTLSFSETAPQFQKVILFETSFVIEQ